MTNKEFADVLMELAAIYEANPEVPQLHALTEGTEFVFCHTREQLDSACDALGPGTASQDESGDAIFKPDRFPYILVHGFTARINETMAEPDEVAF